MQRIKLWHLNADHNPEEVEEVVNIESEALLEDVIVNNPDILIPGLRIVGRQNPTEGGYLDLLGIDQDGTLMVFELKRGTLTRDAVAQVIDYASALGGLDQDTLFRHISDRSGHGGVDKIEDFENWYVDLFSGSMDGLDNPIRMVLVGLGADDKCRRMVEYLAGLGVDISLLTFYSFKKGEDLFLARQEDVVFSASQDRQRSLYNKANNQQFLNQMAARLDVSELLEKMAAFVLEQLPAFYQYPGKTCYSFSLSFTGEDGAPTRRKLCGLHLSDVHPQAVQFYLQPPALAAADEHYSVLEERFKQQSERNKYGAGIWLQTEDWEQDTMDGLRGVLQSIAASFLGR